MLSMLPVFLMGIVVDDRIITGMPAWLKPSKFAISTAIFSATMAWLYRYLTVWPRFLRTAAWIISVVFVIEVAIIATQAARGTTSHFNVRTPLDGALFASMGVGIAILWLTTVGILIALFKQRFDSPEWGRWLRMGMLVSVLGSATGGLMTSPTPAQIEEIKASGRSAFIGAHTVGAPDGGTGLPGVGWSVTHGDLRVPHFLGLHGIQLLPLLGWFLMRRGSVSGFAYRAGASYLALFGILIWQALRGQALLSPDTATSITLSIWLAATVAALAPSFRLRTKTLAVSRHA